MKSKIKNLGNKYLIEVPQVSKLNCQRPEDFGCAFRLPHTTQTNALHTLLLNVSDLLCGAPYNLYIVESGGRYVYEALKENNAFANCWWGEPSNIFSLTPKNSDSVFLTSFKPANKKLLNLWAGVPPKWHIILEDVYDSGRTANLVCGALHTLLKEAGKDKNSKVVFAPLIKRVYRRYGGKQAKIRKTYKAITRLGYRVESGKYIKLSWE